MSAKNAILKALIEGAIIDLMVKTNVENVKVDESTTLAAKLSEIITALNNKATKDSLASYPTRDEMELAISTAIAGLINGAPSTYDTLKEISDYIAENSDVVESLNAAIGTKADATVVASIQATVNALGTLATLNVVSEDNLDASLKAKVNAGAEGNHTHSNKGLLDTYDQTNSSIKAAVEAKHTHINKTTLDGVTASKVGEWDGKCKFYASTTQPSELTVNDLWIQIVE